MNADRQNGGTRRPRVAFVIHDFDQTYGQGRYGIELARHLAAECDFTVYSNTFKAPGLEGVRWVRIPAWRWNVVTTVATFLPAAEWRVRRDRPDVIHAQGLTCWSADVVTAHICNAARARTSATRNRRARWFIRGVTPLERAFYRQRRARHLIAISHSIAGEIETEYDWRRPVSVLHHGTNTVQFRPAADAAEVAGLRAKFRVPAERWIWLFMGEAVKGLRQVVEQLPGFPGAHLLVISRSDMAPYQARARQLGALDRITFFGYSPHPEEAFRAADVFVYPSDYDPFGMVGSEAMASGLPVILGREIGAAELMEHGTSGLLCAPEEPGSIRDQLQRLESNPAAAREMGRKAREAILGTSWEHNAREVLGLYRALMPGGPGHRA